ncbi:DUF485 domain-containing protein [Aquipuribacter nitratireducens]|uniref:DUF485 domain-containing protein n=1 Tax=Aquipuribacter nitratireducens TaxID=650104 RepID=A0ABW0GW23_9MICO
MSTTHEPRRHTAAPEDDVLTTWQEVQANPEFQALRRAFRRFVFPMTVAFLVWYFTYVLLAAYATEFFATPVFGNVNVGILFGLGQFASTALITAAYVRWANRNFDAKAEHLAGTVRLEEHR